MRQPHARPQWQVQAEEIERYNRRARRRHTFRKWRDYGTLVLAVVFVVFLIVVAWQEGI